MGCQQVIDGGNLAKLEITLVNPERGPIMKDGANKFMRGRREKNGRDGQI